MKPTNNLQTNHLKLYRLVELVREIYPNQRTENPYQNQIQQQVQRLSLDQQILLCNLIHTLTVLNHHGRKTTLSASGGKPQILQSSELDNLNALELILSKEEKLCERTLEFKEKIENLYNYEPFLKQEALRKLKISSTTFLRYARKLKSHGMMHYIGNVRTNYSMKSMYQLTKNTIELNPENNLEEDAWQEAMKEHEEFQGFTELQYRTDYSPSKE